MKLVTVLGPLDPDLAGITDAHNHAWIEPVPGGPPDAPVLNDQEAILKELIEYREAGGSTLVDCQPGGCGRNGRMLRTLSAKSGVNIIACTGYHLRKYYPHHYGLFHATPDAAQQSFVREIQRGLEECSDLGDPVLAGFIKIACQAKLGESPLNLMEAAVGASLATGAAIEVHTEKGSDAERIVRTLFDSGLPPGKLILCHMDKRADLGLHQALAGEGVLLEYDTFYRQKYQPDQNVWPLLEAMVEHGFEAQVAVATDIAEANMWKTMGTGPGLSGLNASIIPRMRSLGFEPGTINKLVGGNIVRCLARPFPIAIDEENIR